MEITTKLDINPLNHDNQIKVRWTLQEGYANLIFKSEQFVGLLHNKISVIQKWNDKKLFTVKPIRERLTSKIKLY